MRIDLVQKDRQGRVLFTTHISDVLLNSKVRTTLPSQQITSFFEGVRGDVVYTMIPIHKKLNVWTNGAEPPDC